MWGNNRRKLQVSVGSSRRQKPRSHCEPSWGEMCRLITVWFSLVKEMTNAGLMINEPLQTSRFESPHKEGASISVLDITGPTNGRRRGRLCFFLILFYFFFFRHVSPVVVRLHARLVRGPVAVVLLPELLLEPRR